MSIPTDMVGMQNGGMEQGANTATVATSGRGNVTRITQVRRPAGPRQGLVDNARRARRELRPRGERFAHLKRMYD